jgi:hypothetical protein
MGEKCGEWQLLPLARIGFDVRMGNLPGVDSV